MECLTVKHNVVEIKSVADFVNINSRMNGKTKEVCFVRLIGCNSSLIKDIQTMDKILGERMQRGKVLYKHIDKLPDYFNADEVSLYTAAYGDWVKCGRESVKITSCDSNLLSAALGNACVSCVRILKRHKPNLSEAMERNFIVKLLYWFDSVMTNLPAKWDSIKSIKIVGENVTKEQEYLFFYLLTLVGCDVLLLQKKCDIERTSESLKLSTAVVVGEFEKNVPVRGVTSSNAGSVVNVHKESSMPVVRIPDRPDRRRVQPSAAVRQSPVVTQPMSSAVRQEVKFSRPNNIPVRTNVKAPQPPRQEKSYEELAALASSIVLIAILDKEGKIKGSGSGIMIGTGGYILTNCHVATAGAAYAVHIEGEEKPYFTDEIIKYHKDLDLALIRIERSLSPLPIYRGSKKLVRGQRVVAIGSPLGLFNSVSDGIISGFRKIDDVDMIQFTAPISNGSSGGAVLNMYGEVVGISTAGIDSGQNLNLAIGYENIIPFVSGFVG